MYKMKKRNREKEEKSDKLAFSPMICEAVFIKYKVCLLEWSLQPYLSTYISTPQYIQYNMKVQV
jgi:hypothetical protein